MADNLDLTRKLGPLPVWGWAVAVAGGYVVFKHFSPSTSSTPVTTPSAAAADQALAGSIVPDTSGGGAGTPTGSPGGPTTNAEWALAAVNALIGQHVDGVAAENAINAYLSGVALTTAQHSLVVEAIQAVGPPPEGVPFSPNQPSGPSTPPGGGGGTPIPLPPGTWKIPGEYTVGSAFPATGKGEYYLSNYGGVAAEGGAPFLGSPISRGLHAPLVPPFSWRWSSIVAYGRGGYQCRSTRGDVQVFGS